MTCSGTCAVWIVGKGLRANCMLNCFGTYIINALGVAQDMSDKCTPDSEYQIRVAAA